MPRLQGVGVLVTRPVQQAERLCALLEAEGETVFDIGRIEAAEGEARVNINLPDGWPG